MMPKSIRNIEIQKFNPYKKRNKLILSWSSLYYDDLKRLKVAVAAEKGTSIVATQHGGSYGYMLAHSRPTEIEFNNDYFISWGWEKTSYTNGNIIPLPSPMLSKMRYTQKTDKIIFVNGPMNVLPKRIDSSFQPNQVVESRNDNIQFLKNLDTNVLDNLYYRPFFNDPGSISDKDFIHETFPNTKIIDGYLHKETEKC